MNDELSKKEKRDAIIAVIVIVLAILIASFIASNLG